MTTKKEALENQQLQNEILIGKKLGIETHWINESEKQKLTNEILTTKKLKQETHWLKSALLPAIQILAALLLAIVTYVIGTNTNVLKSQSTKIEIDKERNEIETILNTNSKILQSMQLTRINDTLSATRKDLENKKSSLWSQIGQLNNVNQQLNLKIIRSKDVNKMLLANAAKLHTGLFDAQKKLDSTNEAITFKEAEYNLLSIKKSAWANNPSVKYLINEIANNPKIAKRIVDSLVQYKRLSVPNLLGVCDFVLFFSTGDEKVIADIQKQMMDNFDISNKGFFFILIF
ncbi:hypothetical protein EWM62_09695 [Mucilaginibacter terrigena]|uniref:Uncharacterized protein n=1 Tax=Mucilaginibacter terrigena TaxID=2492395 RepID=A0A4Q5LM93_9SPHI|nr:hypothetical protein [Mucilaginibacter terrigena]RYU90901.1 hypothetical protein EWM62_09695 [Mucilaginibacter terrigena]